MTGNVCRKNKEFKKIGLGLASGFLSTLAFIGANGLLRGSGRASAAITALYGVPTTVAFTVGVHLLNGSLMGGIYALGVNLLPDMDRAKEIAAGGIGYGLFTTVVFAGGLMPVWLNLVGYAPGIKFSMPPLLSFVTHIVYATFLAGLYRYSREKVV